MIIVISFISFLLSFLSLIFKLLVFNNVYLKCLLLVLILTFILYIYTQPIRNRLVLSKLRTWKNRFPYGFMLRTSKDKIVNLVNILLYILIFIVGFLSLRFLNRNKAIDLKIYYIKFYHIIHNMSIFEIYLNVFLLISIILLYMQILYKIVKYFKLHLLKRHIYWSSPRLDNAFSVWHYTNIIRFRNYVHPNGIYDIIETRIHKIFYTLWLRTNPSIYELFGSHNFPLNYCENISYLYYRTPLEDYIETILRKIVNKFQYSVHKYILFIIILYDILFNDCVLTLMYKILPYVYIYEIIVRISRFRDHSVDVNDQIIYEMLYERSEKVTDNEFLVGHTYITTEELEEIVKYYVLTDLQDVHGKWSSIPIKEQPRYNIRKIYERIQGYLDNYKQVCNTISVIWIVYLLEILQRYIISII
jgi:hypothetical protein